MINPSEIRVLIAEDEPDLRELLAAKFRVFGFDVITAHNGTAAWDKILESTNIQIVITDIRMPNGTGYELLTKCKQRDPAFPRVFLISAFSDYSEAHLFDLGSEGFISKPFDTKDLLSIVRKSLLRITDRWRGQNVEIPEFKLNFNGKSLEVAQKLNQIKFGRGGFCLKVEDSLPEIDESVYFEIDADPWKLNGTGILRWSSSNNENKYAGVEIVSLDGASRQDFIDWIENEKPKPFIPAMKSVD